MHRRLSLVIVALLALLLRSPVAATTFAAPQCFPTIPGISNCIDGRFKQFWNTNGGVPIFGYPITRQRDEVNNDTARIFPAQRFEGYRFEYHPANQPPYDVLLGRLGDELLLAQSRDWNNEPTTDNPLGGACRHFTETNRDVCGPFLTYWMGHGLREPKLDAYGNSLATFGFPLTGVKMETNPQGTRVLTQWFERARFELHPEGGTSVLLGPLGTEAGTKAPPPLIDIVGPCMQNEPEFADGGQAWVTNPTPLAGGDETVCARLQLQGLIESKVRVTITVHYKSKDIVYIGQTDVQGVAAITFRVDRTSVGYPVIVNVRFGTGQRTSTSFTSQ